MADEKPIIVIKKKGGHGGHHGGAWKIAYADFVTAMMAFFMVMWLINSASERTKQAIASYFRRPGLFVSGSGTPLEIGGAGFLEDGQPPAKFIGESDNEGEIKEPVKRKDDQTGPILAGDIDIKIAKLKELIKQITKTDEKTAGELLNKAAGLGEQEAEMEDVAEMIRQQITTSPELKELLGTVDVKVDADGLNIEIMDTDKSSMFALGSPRIQPEAEEAFTKISKILATVPNTIDIVGHTDAKPFASRTGSYSNWELSTDRANAARKLLESQGIAPERIRGIVGKADTELKEEKDPFSAANRRITLKMRFNAAKTVNLAQDPKALEKLPLLEQKYNEDQARVEAANVHSFTVKEIIKGNKDKKPSPLPESSGTGQQPTEDPIGKDKIFGDSPVISPREFFEH